MQARFPSITRSSRRSDARRGSLAPAAIVALVVVVSGVALVLDKLWLDAAHSELTTAVEAAALSSGRSLASDDLLRATSDPEARLEQARQFAVQLAAKNRIAGVPVELDPSPEGSIRFGKLVVREDLAETVFVETADNPTSVVVTGEHSHTRNNPVALFWQGLTGVTHGNVFARAEASVSNHIVAFRPLDGVPIPVLPLAILKNPKPQQDPNEPPVENWETQIENRQGADLSGFDPETHQVTPTSDGIPEITLRTVGSDGQSKKANAYLFALDRVTTMDEVQQHVARGWTIADFKSTPPELRLDRSTLSFQTIPSSGGDLAGLLHRHLGECRIVFLYEHCEGNTLTCVGAVAGRILQVTDGGSGACKLVFQPGVLTTRTAVLANETLVPITHTASANKYVYKLQLTF